LESFGEKRITFLIIGLKDPKLSLGYIKLLGNLQSFPFKSYPQINMKKMLVLIFFTVFCLVFIQVVNSVSAQGFNVASTYQIADSGVVSGDIIISEGENGFKRTNVSYESKIFGVYQEKPELVLRESTQSAKQPIIRLGDTTVNITDYNGDIKAGDFVTTSPVMGKGMKAAQSGYVLGIALEDAELGNNTTSIFNRQVRNGTVKVAVRIEYAELTTSRNSLRLLDSLNSAFFRNVQDPEKFTNTLRYIIAGFLGLLVFAIGFFWVARSLSKAVEAIGRNPLARQSILASLAAQIVVTLVVSAFALGAIFVIIRF
jgi:hypothetical protein